MILNALILLLPTLVFADSQLARPYLNLKQAAMGGLQYTSEGHLESVFGNPAALSFETKDRFEVFDWVTEGTPQTYWRFHKLLGSTETALETLGDAAGKNHHLRLQLALFSYFKPGFRKWDQIEWSWGLTWLNNLQGDLGLRRMYRASSWLAFDFGPHFVNSFKFKLGLGSLAVGAAAHLKYRLSNARDYPLTDYIKGKSIDPITSGGDGGHLDFGLGVAYQVPFERGFTGTLSLGLQNVRDGPFNDFRFGFTKAGLLPEKQPREFGFGISLKKQTWPMPDADVLFSIEAAPIGAQPEGSFFKLLNFGSELSIQERYFVRTGFHQGYWAGGIGYKGGSSSTQFELRLATYSEEMGLTTGEKEDRRVGLEVCLSL